MVTAFSKKDQNKSAKLSTQYEILTLEPLSLKIISTSRIGPNCCNKEHIHI